MTITKHKRYRKQTTERNDINIQKPVRLVEYISGIRACNYINQTKKSLFGFG